MNIDIRLLKKCILFFVTFLLAILLQVKVFAETFPAILQSSDEVSIKSKTQGQVTKIFFKEGDLVKQNEVLAIIDDEQEKIELDSAKLEMDSAKIDFEKSQKLKKFISEDELYNKEVNYLKKKSAYELKLYSFNNTRITSPIDGLISKQNIKEWATVNSGELTYEVIKPESLVIELDIGINKSRKLKIGQSLKFKTEYEKNKNYDATVFFVGNVIDKASGTVKIKLKLENKMINQNDWELKPGSLVQLEI
ncbi:MAG: efflux RND transporter periplasmic adaptor subunit [Oligoflexia bacterium]|nr:efflux RND transporter periplasmic adaptor subunit [Oligoflexia bacterium]